MVLLLLSLFSGCHLQARPAAVDGVYTLCEEVQGYSGETLELKDGKFRYWFYSDVATGDEPKYPLTGTYTVNGSSVKLDHPQIRRDERVLATVNGVRVLWRADGLKAWEKDQRLHPYAILIRVEGAASGETVKRPSLELLKTPEMRDREKREYEERFNDVPVEARTLLRARTMEGDPDMDAYKAEVMKARSQPDAKLVGQLITLISIDSHVPAERILQDLYGSSFLIEEPPAFKKDPAALKKALEALVVGVASAKDRYGLEAALLTFLRASGVPSIYLPVDGTGITINLATLGRDGYRSSSEGTPADDVRWKKRMDKLIPACQEWMRVNLPK